MTQGHQVHGSRVAIIDRAGIPPESLHVCGIDSYTTEAYFSARGEGVQCGRIINAIKLIWWLIAGQAPPDWHDKSMDKMAS